jgi:hypothetical protein
LEFARVFLKNPEIFFKNLAKSVCVQARELKFCMNMLCYFKYEIAYSNLELNEIRLSGFLKNPDIFLKNVKTSYSSPSLVEISSRFQNPAVFFGRTITAGLLV